MDDRGQSVNASERRSARSEAGSAEGSGRGAFARLHSRHASRRFAVVLCGLLIAASTDAGTVQTRDGVRHEGIVALEDGRIVVKQAGSGQAGFELGEIALARFVDDGNGDLAAPASSGPNQQPAPKPQPKRLTGLRAEYHAGYDLNDLKLVRVDPKLETWWPMEGTPDPAVPSKFSARWTGQIEPKYSETYTFQAGFDSGGRLWIDNRLLIDHWKESGTFGTKIDLVAGRKYDLKMEFRKGQWGGNVRLYWSSASQGQEAVPPQAFTPPPGTVPPLVRISSPASGSVSNSARPMVLEADASDADGSVREVEFFGNGRSLGVAREAPWRVEWKAPPCGYHKVLARATDSAGISATSEVAQVAVAADAGGALTGGWLEMPVGRSEVMGSSSVSGGRLTLKTSRGNLWDEQDSFHFVFQPLHGDGVISVRLLDLAPRTVDGVGAGLIMREGLGVERSRLAFLGIRHPEGLVFSRRENIWEDRRESSDEAATPCYLRLSRHGKLVRAHRSADGRKWDLLGQRSIDLPATVYVGLAIVSPEGEPAEAAFEQLAMTAGGPEMESTVRGLVLRSGSLIAGQVHGLDDTSVRMNSQHGQLVIPTSLVARVLIRPLTREAVERLQPRRTGAILNNGDFYDGSVSFAGDAVRVDSVLFGVRKFNTWDQTVAAILNDVESPACRYEVACTDGSRLRARAIAADGHRLKLTDASGIELTVSSRHLAEIRRVD